MSKHPRTAGFDLRVTAYRSVRILLLVIAAAFLVRATLFDTVRVLSGQMDPTIVKGDRLLVFRTPFIPWIRAISGVQYDKTVVYRSVFAGGHSGVLRIAGFSGDTVGIDSGKFVAGRPLPRCAGFNQEVEEIVPGEYTPRDFLEMYRIPSRGDLLLFNRLSLRDFFFAFSIVRQEQSSRSVTLTPYLHLDDSLSNEYIISDFAFYSGSIRQVPDSLRYDWFFWNRLEEFLFQKYDDRKVSLYFTISVEGTVIEEYKVKDDYLFLLADNRSGGLDSRYFGPVGMSHCLGRAIMVLWSHGSDNQGSWSFRFRRVGKIIQ